MPFKRLLIDQLRLDTTMKDPLTTLTDNAAVNGAACMAMPATSPASVTACTSPAKLTGAQLVIKLLEQEGVRHVFGIPGGSNLPLYDALSASVIQHILARHEQGAGFMAQGMARVTGKPEVCFASSGPGATNLITAVADANMDSIPLVAITGQVPRHLIGTDAFQEVDTVSLMKPITKFCCQADSADELRRLIPEAFRIARSGRPGPVAIDIPKDVQLQTLSEAGLSAASDEASAFMKGLPLSNGAASAIKVLSSPAVHTNTVADLLASIDSAQKPLLMVGAGVIRSQASDALQCFVERRHIPVVHTLHGLGALPSTHAMSLGMMGMHAARSTNQLLDECDLLIGLGVRFDDRATGLASAFCPQADIIHVDIDSSEFGKIITPTWAIHADVGDLLRALNSEDVEVVDTKKTLWLQRVSQLQSSAEKTVNHQRSLQNPCQAIETIARYADSSALVTTDVGQHQMWVAQAFPLQFAGQLITSGGLGTMGFGLPAAIGCALAQPKSVLCFTGDGSLMMNLQELATMAELDLNIKVIVFNNGHLGMVRQQQQLFYQQNYQAIEFKQQTNFVLAANSMGVPGIDLQHCQHPEASLHEALNSAGPCLINLPISEEEMVFPMVPPGGANSDMIDAGSGEIR